MNHKFKKMLKILIPIIFLSFSYCYRLFIPLAIINFIFFSESFAENLETTVGKETGLDIPRYVSLKVTEANMRRGPSLEHKIDWVYKRKNLPMRIIGEFGHWRHVEDFQGQRGWMYKSLLSGKRFSIVIKEETLLRNKNNSDGLGKAILKKNVIVKAKKCDIFWCFIEVEKLRGWVLKSDIWGIKKLETF